MQLIVTNNYAKDKSFRGFTLIELLVVVGIIGIIAAIAIPGLMLAQGRALQKATVAEMRTWGSYINSYQIDNQGRVPNADGDFPKLHSVIASIYNVNPRLTDQWGWGYGYTKQNSVEENYELRSFGSDGIPGALFMSTSPRAALFLDIAYENGQFISHVKN